MAPYFPEGELQHEAHQDEDYTCEQFQVGQGASIWQGDAAFDLHRGVGAVGVRLAQGEGFDGDHGRVGADAVMAEDLAEIPACGEVQRHLSAAEFCTIRAARRHVDGDETGEARDEMVGEGDTQNLVVDQVWQRVGPGAVQFKRGNLLAGPEFGDALALGSLPDGEPDFPRLVAIEAPAKRSSYRSNTRKRSALQTTGSPSASPWWLAPATIRRRKS